MEISLHKALKRISISQIALHCIAIVIAYAIGAHLTGRFHASSYMGAMLACTSTIVVIQSENVRESIHKGWLRVSWYAHWCCYRNHISATLSLLTSRTCNLILHFGGSVYDVKGPRRRHRSCNDTDNHLCHLTRDSRFATIKEWCAALCRRHNWRLYRHCRAVDC